MYSSSRSLHVVQSRSGLASLASSSSDASGGNDPISCHWPRRLRVAKRQSGAAKSDAPNGNGGGGAALKIFLLDRAAVSLSIEIPSCPARAVPPSLRSRASAARDT